MANKGWMDIFPQALVKHSFANSSDHVPIVLYDEEDNLISHCSVSRFEPMWLRHVQFKEEVRQFWSSSSSNVPLSRKLKQCMDHLSHWNASTFGNVKKKIKALKESIQQIRSSPRTDENVDTEARLSEELDEWLEREEIRGRQRARAERLKNGDRNTAYFHARASQRKRRNHIDNLRNSEGVLCSAEHEKASIIVDYFYDIYCSQVSPRGERWRHEFNMIPKLVTDEMNAMLTAPFTKGEVKRALFQMHPTKAPGLDGFSALFYQINWKTLGHDVVNEDVGLIEGIKICKNAPIISHLMFADDFMLFIKAEKDAVRWIKDILDRYEAVSGQKVNFRKSEAVCSRNARISRGDVLKFWWSHAKERGIHWVKVDDLYKGKWNGGLGFRKFEVFNMALLAKQGWRLLTSPELLVSKLFSA
ncbi:hypothetical protein QQ045_014947 [Rhodiola kirilowii]